MGKRRPQGTVSLLLYFPNMQTVMPPTRLQLLRDTQWTSPFTAVTRVQIPSGLPFSMTCLKQVEATFKEQRELTP